MFNTKIRWIRFANSKTELELVQNNRTIRPIRINNKSLLLIHHQKEFYLTKSICPHQSANLNSATCEDGFIVCPWHRYGFNLKTGRGAGLHLETFPVEFRVDGVYAGFEYLSFF